METPRFDYFPPGTPRVTNDTLDDIIADAVDERTAPGLAWEAYENAQVRELRNKPRFRDELRLKYDNAGVNLVCATHWSLDPRLPFAEGVLTDLARWRSRFDSVDWLEHVTTPEEARSVVDADDIGIVSTVQNVGKASDGNVEKVETLYNAGVRIGQLTYNSQNAIGTGCTERSDGGLTYHGLDVVAKMNELNMVVDLSHCGKQTTLDAIEASDDPVAFTHTFSQELADHNRGKSSEELEALRENGGYMGILALPAFIAPGKTNPGIDNFLDHLDHAVTVLGVNNVGIGTDWGMTSPDVPAALYPELESFFRRNGFRGSEENKITIGEGLGAFKNYEDFGVIRDGLAERGYSTSEIHGILGENFLEFWDKIGTSD